MFKIPRPTKEFKKVILVVINSILHSAAITSIPNKLYKSKYYTMKTGENTRKNLNASKLAIAIIIIPAIPKPISKPLW
jgi:hypothetical protein